MNRLRTLADPVAEVASSRGFRPAPRADWRWEAERDSLGRRAAFLLGLALIFLRFSTLHELLAWWTGINLYPLYVIGVPALLGAILAGGLRRTYTVKPAWYWTGFLLCMVTATLFSVWRGGSVSLVSTYVKSEFPMLMVTGGLAVTWPEVRRMIHVIAGSAVFYLGVVWIFMRGDSSRVSVLFGTMANSNDLAAYLLLVLPFLLFVALDPATPRIVRLSALAATGFGLYLIPASGSRGALVALAAVCGFVLFRGARMLRLATLALIVIGMVSVPFLVPGESYQRLLSFVPNERAPAEAVAAMDQRAHLLKESVLMTLQHPLFGTGPGQFMVQEDIDSRAEGEARGAWLATHNVYTQVSSECGIPALIFFLAGIVSSFRLLSKTRRQASQNPSHQQIATAAFCMMISFVGFCVAITFLNLAYSFSFPALVGLAAALANAAAREFSAGTGTLGSAVVPAPSKADLGRTQRPSASKPRPRSSR